SARRASPHSWAPPTSGAPPAVWRIWCDRTLASDPRSVGCGLRRDRELHPGRLRVTPTDIDELLPYLTDEERAELDALVAADLAERPWVPLPGPQTLAYESKADVIGFGGAAGGGKTDLAVGDALTKRHEIMVMRREATQLQGV